MNKHSTIVAVLIVIASLRIASTYRVFSDTADEANHVGAGLDLYQNHRYIVQDENPPLPRLVLAAAPYLGGMRRDMSVDFSQQLQSVFANGKYERDLVLARIGNLVFFVLASIAVWFLARRVLDEKAALIALALFTTQPVILGYSGLATHDAAAVAGTALGLLAFVRWLDEPSLARAAVFGVAYGFGALCKFSCLLFVAAACAVLFLYRRRNPLQLLIAPVTALATIAIGYAFHLAPFFHGMRAIFALDREGFLSYALGRYTMHGWWWYFPLAFAVKTTLALLLLFIAGAFFGNRQWTLVTLVMILPALPSSLDLGVRYVLPVYVPFSIAVAAMCRRRIVVALLLAWHLVASTLAHPDYFPYFNEIAARQPQRFRADSNLDWGQDLLRLARYCREHHVNALAYALFSPSDPNRTGLPRRIDIDWSTPPKVPAALSESTIILTRATLRDAYPWADDLPYVRIGKSIRVYRPQSSGLRPR
ncbi:MAG TPA: glycosyltransferase family 39 protein [Thermoanaerobaculia bacterium]